MPPDLATIPADHRLGTVLRRATGLLRRAGLPEPGRDAVRLAADLLAESPGQVALDAGRLLRVDDVDRILAAARRRASGEPLPYVTRLAGFRRLTLHVDSRVLIPRPETEGLVDLVLRLAPTGVAVDVGTGSGCIALSLRQEGGYHRVVGVDRCRAALAVAHRNRSALGLPVDLVQADLVGCIGSGTVDALVANPPYVSAAEFGALDRSVRDYEPRLALESGTDGLAATRRLLVEGRRVLRPGGLLALEVATSRARAVRDLALAAGWSDVRIEDDLFGRARYLLGWRTRG